MGELVVARTDVTGMSFDAYQAGVDATAIFDDPQTKTLIRGVDADVYLLDGLREEHDETLEPGTDPTQYCRLGMVALHSDDELLETYRQNGLEVIRHRKEFGDELWYTVISLLRMKLTLQQVTGVPNNGAPATFAQFDRQAIEEFATAEPLEPYKQAFESFADSAAEHLQRPTALTGTIASASARLLLGNMSWIVQDRLQTTLGDVAQCNLDKLKSRHVKGNIFGSGDDR